MAALRRLLGEGVRDALQAQIVIAALIRCATGAVSTRFNRLGRGLRGLVGLPRSLAIARRISTLVSGTGAFRRLEDLLFVSAEVELRREQGLLIGAALRLRASARVDRLVVRS